MLLWRITFLQVPDSATLLFKKKISIHWTCLRLKLQLFGDIKKEKTITVHKNIDKLLRYQNSLTFGLSSN